MADDRYNWLDKDAAERLLRGEPVGSQVGDGARELQQLLKAAAAAGSGRSDPVALPGEEAALAAFRAAHQGAGARRSGLAGGAALPTVRTGRRAERTRLARPFRRGFAVALAACAISGIAVAAGTGVLPTPFRSGDPKPGASVSAAETPSTFETQAPATTTGETDRTPATPPDGQTTAPGSTPTPGSSHSAGHTPGTPTPGTGTPGDEGNLPSDADGEKKKRLLLALCKNYESGKRGDMDRDMLRRLEAKAGGPGRVHAFCRQYLAQPGRPGGGSGDNDGAGGGNGNGGNGNGNGGGNGHGGGDHDGNGGGDEEGDPSPGASPSKSPQPGGTTPAPPPSPATPTPTGTIPAG